MFQVGRYDPQEAERNAQKNKGKHKGHPRKRNRRDREHPHTSPGLAAGELDAGAKGTKRSLYVIAPETAGPTSVALSRNRGSKVTDEAFDDLDLIDELIGDVDSANILTRLDENDDKRAAEDEEFNQKALPQSEVEVALRMVKQPIDQAATAWKIAPFLTNNLKRDGFANFFPIQALAIPDVIASERHAYIQARDVCITAPTGSGKTLAYVLPVLNSLANRKIRRLRALVVLPSRDLANQVFKVFKSFMEGSDLKVGLAIGQSDFVAEQMAMSVDPDINSQDSDTARRRLAFDTGNVSLALQAFEDGNDHDLPEQRDLQSTIDVLVCTPGRLVDHLDNTPGFSLEHLRFLIVDEADRLLSQTYHNWIGRVIQSANSGSVAAWKRILANDNELPMPQVSKDGASYCITPTTWRRGGVVGDDTDFNTNDSYRSVASSVCRPVQLRKFLVSATLTRDPQKLASLKLVNPKHFDVHQLRTGHQGFFNTNTKKYSMPEGLHEHTVECTAEQKPIVLLALLLDQLTPQQSQSSSKQSVIVFTASLDSTHRLARLLQLLWVSAGYGEPDSVVEFSSALNQHERSALMKRCNDPHDKVSVVVCSDGMSRGMDIDAVRAVINYDVPGLAKTYVHRCGRTARAGKEGHAISLLKGGQTRQFDKMRQLIHNTDQVDHNMSIKKHLVRDAIPKYRHCVEALRDVLDAEENGELSHVEAINEDFFQT